MKTFAINTLGCKINQYESQQMRELLEQLDMRNVEATQKPDLIVINTCCVTHSASSKSRQSVRRAQRLNPEAQIIVAGCLPTYDTDELGYPGPVIHLIGHQQGLLNRLKQITGKKTSSFQADNKSTMPRPHVTTKPESTSKLKAKSELVGQRQLPSLSSYTGRTRAFLKVQDGCDGFCSYCIIPSIRTNVSSKEASAVIQEAQRLVAAGHKEIVLTGIFLGAYGQNTVRRNYWHRCGTDRLAELVVQIAQVPGLERLRLSSLEPGDLTDALLDVFCTYQNIAPHLHLPLQSGSERILRRMCRQYTATDYRKTLEKLRLRLDRPAITTDIIVGFPGETQQDFEETVRVAEEAGFAKMHIFPFSRRRGTAADKIQDQVPQAVIKERSQSLHKLDKQLGRRFRGQFTGEIARVIVEQTTPARGRCERYYMLQLHGNKTVKIGQFLSARIRGDALTADIIESYL
ncbi:MAG: tRNA (N(6)-L-threonylcarbamoyladenosine(37)-C(2))-methylthiotransferase MtaB [Planctomycetota bacterium]